MREAEHRGVKREARWARYERPTGLAAVLVVAEHGVPEPREV
jgi:hypothetical protein